MTTAEKFEAFLQCLKCKSVWFAVKTFYEEPIVKFYHSKIGKTQKIKITFRDESEWEGEEKIGGEVDGL